MRWGIFVSFLGLTAMSHGQSFTNVDWLQDRSRRWSIQSQIEKADAELRGFVPVSERSQLMAIRPHGLVVYGTAGVEAADTVSADEVWPGGSLGLSLSGMGVDLGIWDAGLAQSNHPELNGRVASGDGTVTVADHSTAVGGVMIAAGVDPLYRGFSFEGGLQSFDFNSDHAEIATAGAGGLRVSNHSYGNAAGWFFNLRGDGRWVWLGDAVVSTNQDFRFGWYGPDAVALDSLLYNAPNLLACQAVGNERNTGPTTQPVEHWEWVSNNWALTSAERDRDGSGTGYDTLMEQACAKNVLSVGPVDLIAGGWTIGASARSLSSASWGPTDDGRIKPDIVACGGSVRTLSAGSGYQTFGGSSLATPNAAGAAGLLIQHYRNTHENANLRASTLKALLVHTADDCGNVGPDYSFGWGLMNVKSAAEVISLDAQETTTVTELTLTQGNEIALTVSSDGSSPLKVTLAWTDPAGPESVVANNPTASRLVNDLDVRVEKGTATFRPFVLDPANPAALATTGINSRDNVEQIVIPNPEPGQYTVRINHKGSVLQPTGTQSLGLVITGRATSEVTSLSLNPPSVIGGTSVTGTVTLDHAAGIGGRTVSLADNSTVVSVPASVLVAQGQTTANFAVSTIGTPTDVTATLTASLNELSVTTTLTVQRYLLSSVRLAPTSVYGGYASTGTVTLSGPAGTAGAGVLLSSANPSALTVPSSVLVANGQTSKTFTATTVPVAANTVVNVTATRAGVTKTYPLSVKAPILASVTVSPNIQAGSLNVTGRVNINTNAPANFVVNVASSSSKATPPATVTIPAGTKFVTFTIPTQTVTAQTPLLISATRASITKQASLALYPTTLHALSVTPTSVKGGLSTTGMVTLSLNAPVATAVLLSSNNPALAAVPASATVAVGAKTRTFAVNTTAVTANQTVTITGNRNGVFRTATLTVTP